MRNLPITLLRILCMWGVNSLSLLLRFSLSGFQQFDYNVSQSESLLVYPTCWASGMFIFSSFTKFGKFWPLFLQTFSLPLFLCLFPLDSRSDDVHLMVSHRSLKLCPLFLNLFFFLLLRLNNFSCSIFKLTDSSVCSNRPWIPLVKFSFLFLYFKLQNLSLTSF